MRSARGGNGLSAERARMAQSRRRRSRGERLDLGFSLPLPFLDGSGRVGGFGASMRMAPVRRSRRGDRPPSSRDRFLFTPRTSGGYSIGSSSSSVGVDSLRSSLAAQRFIGVLWSFLFGDVEVDACELDGSLCSS